MQATTIPIHIVSAATSGYAARLSSELSKELRRDPRFKLAISPSTGDLVVTLPSELGWQRRLDWTEVSYRARLDWPGGRSVPIAGACWNWNMRSCARNIADAAYKASQ